MVKNLPLVYAALFSPDDNGACRFLEKSDDGKCSCGIYNMRPLICDVGWVADNRGPMMGLDDDAFVKMTENACELLRKTECVT